MHLLIEDITWFILQAMTYYNTFVGHTQNISTVVVVCIAKVIPYFSFVLYIGNAFLPKTHIKRQATLYDYLPSLNWIQYCTVRNKNILYWVD